MSHLNPGLLSAYNSLTDKHLTGYFSNTRIRRHLIHVGLITRSGTVVPDKEYRQKMMRKEHQRHMRECLAQAIFHKVLDIERHQQIQIRRKLEDFAQKERVHKIKVERSRRYDTIITVHSPRPPSGPRRSNTQHSSAEGDQTESSDSPNSTRPNTAPGKMQRPVRLKPIHSSSTATSTRPLKDRTDSVDQQANSAIDQDTCRSDMKPFTNGISPYQLPVINNFVTPVPPPVKRKERIFKGYANGSMRGRRLRPTTAPNLAVVIKESRFHKTSIHSNVAVTMMFYGKSVHLSGEDLDPRDEVRIFQQHCGGENVCVYKGKLMVGDTFQFVSRRHRGFPFSLTFFLNGIQVDRLSSCCEFRHRKCSRLGGKHGYFGFLCVDGASPCYKCIIALGLDKKPTPPPKRLKEDSDTGDMFSSLEKAESPQEDEEENLRQDIHSPVGLTSSHQVSPMNTDVQERAKEKIKGKDDYEEDFEADDERVVEETEDVNKRTLSPFFEEQDSHIDDKEVGEEGHEEAEKEDNGGYSESEEEENGEPRKNRTPSVSSRSGSFSSGSSKEDSDSEVEQAKETITDHESNRPSSSLSRKEMTHRDDAEDNSQPTEDKEPENADEPLEYNEGAPEISEANGPAAEAEMENSVCESPNTAIETGALEKSAATLTLENSEAVEPERAKSVQEKLAEAIMIETQCNSEPELSDTTTEEEEEPSSSPQTTVVQNGVPGSETEGSTLLVQNPSNDGQNHDATVAQGDEAAVEVVDASGEADTLKEEDEVYGSGTEKEELEQKVESDNDLEEETIAEIPTEGAEEVNQENNVVVEEDGQQMDENPTEENPELVTAEMELVTESVISETETAATLETNSGDTDDQDSATLPTETSANPEETKDESNVADEEEIMTECDNTTSNINEDGKIERKEADEECIVVEESNEVEEVCSEKNEEQADDTVEDLETSLEGETELEHIEDILVTPHANDPSEENDEEPKEDTDELEPNVEDENIDQEDNPTRKETETYDQEEDEPDGHNDVEVIDDDKLEEEEENGDLNTDTHKLDEGAADVGEEDEARNREVVAEVSTDVVETGSVLINEDSAPVMETSSDIIEEDSNNEAIDNEIDVNEEEISCTEEHEQEVTVQDNEDTSLIKGEDAKKQDAQVEADPEIKDHTLAEESPTELHEEPHLVEDASVIPMETKNENEETSLEMENQPDNLENEGGHTEEVVEDSQETTLPGTSETEELVSHTDNIQDASDETEETHSDDIEAIPNPEADEALEEETTEEIEVPLEGDAEGATEPESAAGLDVAENTSNLTPQNDQDEDQQLMERDPVIERDCEENEESNLEGKVSSEDLEAVTKEGVEAENIESDPMDDGITNEGVEAVNIESDLMDGGITIETEHEVNGDVIESTDDVNNDSVINLSEDQAESYETSGDNEKIFHQEMEPELQPEGAVEEVSEVPDTSTNGEVENQESQEESQRVSSGIQAEDELEESFADNILLKNEELGESAIPDDASVIGLNGNIDASDDSPQDGGISDFPLLTKSYGSIKLIVAREAMQQHLVNGDEVTEDLENT